MSKDNDVSQTSSPDVSEDVKPQEQAVSTPAEVEETPATPGSKTPEANHLVALQQERDEKKRLKEDNQALEDKVKELESATPPISDNEMSDEGRQLKQEIAEIKHKSALKDAEAQYPQLKDKSTEFKEFQEEYPGLSVDKAAKVFLVENDLLEGKPKRKGLEKQTGGTSTSPSKMSAEQVKNLRKTDWRKYTKMIDEGLIRAEDIE